MSTRQKRYQKGSLEWGYDMPRTPIYVHAIGLIVMGAVMLFSYTALLEDGALTAMVGFVFGVFFLMLVYGHELDKFYIHIGDKLKFGVDSFDPQREVESKDND